MQRITGYLALVVAVTLTALGVYLMLTPKRFGGTLRLPASARSKVGFALYAPGAGSPLRLLADSVQLHDSTVVYQVHMPGFDHDIGVSLQAKPTDFDPLADPSASTPLPISRGFVVGYGHARLDQWGARTVVSAITDHGTWVIMNVTGMDENLAKEAARSLVRVD